MPQRAAQEAPAAHLAPLVDYADLDGAALLRTDPFSGPHLAAGRIVLDETRNNFV